MRGDRPGMTKMRLSMKRPFRKRLFESIFAVFMVAPGLAGAASIKNADATDYTFIVTEGGERSEIAVGGGRSVTICPSGCFLTLPNGDRAALGGSESIEITNGKVSIK